ncbi:hypothetical protein [Pseudomonas brassicacearum]|uniref:hypothetical protein n=1 Tax=Pseudomonas brassicacearum TaxID=930166 RepID=UPI000A8496CE|nr:hypothetical protein [Pseudomonas brassicacearum]
MNDKFNPEDMSVLNLNTTSTTRYEASRFLDTPEAIAAYLAERMKADNTESLIHVLAEVEKILSRQRFRG